MKLERTKIVAHEMFRKYDWGGPLIKDHTPKKHQIAVSNVSALHIENTYLAFYVQKLEIALNSVFEMSNRWVWTVFNIQKTRSGKKQSEQKVAKLKTTERVFLD